jgi:hypothetical protein
MPAVARDVRRGSVLRTALAHSHRANARADERAAARLRWDAGLSFHAAGPAVSLAAGTCCSGTRLPTRSASGATYGGIASTVPTTPGPVGACVGGAFGARASANRSRAEERAHRDVPKSSILKGHQQDLPVLTKYNSSPERCSGR